MKLDRDEIREWRRQADLANQGSEDAVTVAVPAGTLEGLCSMALAYLDAQEWRPIETAPRDGSYILVYRPDISTPVHAVRWDRTYDNGWYIQGIGAIDPKYPPTHWLPLPQPPKEKP